MIDAKTLTRRLHHLTAALVIFVIGPWGALFILAFAGVTVRMVSPGLLQIHNPPTPSDALGQIIAAAVSWFAGSVALGTYVLTREQKERHLDDQLTEQRQLAELQRMETQFSQLAEDFASDTVLNRINAAIGMAELAMTVSPRAKQIGDKFEKSESNYPYFLRATHRLAAALHQWGEQPPRDEVRKALALMGSFAKEEDTDEILLHALCNSLADANRTALAIFIDALAEGLACEATDILESLVRFCQFHGIEEQNYACLRTFSEDKSLQAAKERWTVARIAMGFATPGGVDPEYLMRFSKAAQSLHDSRDALARAMRELSKPLQRPDQDQQFAESVRVPFVLELSGDWRKLNFEGVFLQGAELSLAQLQGANLCRAHLQQASLIEACLNEASLRRAHLDGADLTCSQFICADLSDSFLKRAFLLKTNLNRADLTHSHMQGTYLRLTVLTETRLYGADCGQSGGKPARFDLTVWSVADFRRRGKNDDGQLGTNVTDKKLLRWLQKTYPSSPPAETEIKPD